MNDLFEFLTSSEAIIVYIVAAISCCLCFIIYLVERNNVKLRQKHNTKELNKLVSQVKEEANIVEQPMYDVPILEPIEESENTLVSEMLAQTQVIPITHSEPVLEPIAQKEEPLEIEPVDILQEANDAMEEELQYTSIEPDEETAQLELKKLTEELQKQEELQEQDLEDLAYTNYEVQQEENAIISLDELVKRSKEMYEANELTQYSDEGNEPISIDELEDKYGKEAASFNEPFEINQVVSDEEVVEQFEEDEPAPVVPAVEPPKRFKSSPIISPIYGIEKQADENHNIELENTANYEKLDAEIQKTNEFLMTLKELQQKIE